MKYILVNWKHSDPRDPVQVYSEIDAEQWEHRKVELFSDGHLGLADGRNEIGGSRLGLEPWPDLEKLGAEPEFEIAEITKTEFETVWKRAAEANVS